MHRIVVYDGGNEAHPMAVLSIAKHAKCLPQILLVDFQKHFQRGGKGHGFVAQRLLQQVGRPWRPRVHGGMTQVHVLAAFCEFKGFFGARPVFCAHGSQVVLKALPFRTNGQDHEWLSGHHNGSFYLFSIQYIRHQHLVAFGPNRHLGHSLIAI